MPARRRGGGVAANDGSFAPTKGNLYEAVKAIFHPSTNPRVSANDADKELDVGAGSSQVGRAATPLATDTAGNAVGTALTQLVVAWASAAGGVANSYDELLVELEYGSHFVYGLMPRARSMLDGKVYDLLSANDGVFTTFAIAFTETNPRQITVRLQAAVAQTAGALKVWGITYQRVTAGGADLSDDTPQAPAAGSAGVSAEASRADHVHPRELVDDAVGPAMLDADSDDKKAAMRTRIGAGTSDFDGAYASLVGAPDLSGLGVDAAARAAAAAAQTTAAAALPKAGGTMTGALTLDGAPTSDLHAATKKYVDDNVGGDSTPTGDLNARVERVNFDDLANGQTDVELTPNALSVVNGAGGNEFLSGISGNDFTLGAGVYLVNIHAVFNFANTSASAWFDLRRASDDAALDHSNPIYARVTTATPWSGRMLVILAADTAVNLLAHRSSNSAMTAVHAEIVKLSSGGAVRSAHNRYVGWAAQQVPSATEIAAGDTFTSDVLTIPAEASDGDGWLWFAVPDDAGAPSAAYFDGNTHDILGGFTRLASGTFAGHIVYASNAEQDPAILGTGSRTITLDYD